MAAYELRIYKWKNTGWNQRHAGACCRKWKAAKKQRDNEKLVKKIMRSSLTRADGYIFSAHVESPEGVRVAPENGVDSIEHAAKNPLDDLRALRNVDMVVARGTIIDHPKIKKKKLVEAELDKFL